MNRRALMSGAAVGGAGLLAAPTIRAQGAWPHGKPIRVIIPWPPGAANDTLGRLLAQRLGEKLGATAVPENRTGGAPPIHSSETRTYLMACRKRV